MNLGTLYLVVAAALIFGACAFAAKKKFRHLNLKQMLVIALVAMLGVVLIWIFLSLWNKKREKREDVPALLPDLLHGRGRLHQIRVGHRDVDRSRLDRYDHPILRGAFRAELHNLAFLAAD